MSGVFPDRNKTPVGRMEQLGRLAEEVARNPLLYLARTSDGVWKVETRSTPDRQIGKVYEALEADMRNWVAGAKELNLQEKRAIASVSHKISEVSNKIASRFRARYGREPETIAAFRAQNSKLSSFLHSLEELPASAGKSKFIFDPKTVHPNDLRKYLESENKEEFETKLKNIGIGDVGFVDFSGRGAYNDYKRLADVFREAGKKYREGVLVANLLSNLERDDPTKRFWPVTALELLEQEERDGKPVNAALVAALKEAISSPAGGWRLGSFEEGDDGIYKSNLAKAWVESLRAMRPDITKMLVRAGLNPNAKDDGGGTQLVVYSHNGDDKTVELLLQAKVGINAMTNFGYTPIMLAALKGHVKIVELLLKAGADVNMRNSQGLTPIMIAAFKGHRDIVEILRNAGANADAKDDEERSAIQMTVDQLEDKGSDERFLEVIYILLDAKDASSALSSMSRENKEQLLSIAYREGDRAKLKILREAGISSLTFEVS